MAIRNKALIYLLTGGFLFFIRGCAPTLQPAPPAPRSLPHNPPTPLGPQWSTLGMLLLCLLAGSAFVLAIAVGLYVFASHRGPQTNQPPTRESSSATAEDILKARYARGEIDRETYLQMLRDLQTPPSPPQPPSA